MPEIALTCKRPGDPSRGRIIEAERRRVRRLMWWTIGVWTFWFLMISVGLVVPMILSHTNPPVPAAITQPAAEQPVVHHQPSGAAAVFAGILGVILFAAFLGLPVAGIVLAIMLIFTRRTVSMNQIRASLAAIDAQLRVLGAAGVQNPGESSGRNPASGP